MFRVQKIKIVFSKRYFNILEIIVLFLFTESLISGCALLFENKHNTVDICIVSKCTKEIFPIIQKLEIKSIEKGRIRLSVSSPLKVIENSFRLILSKERPSLDYPEQLALIVAPFFNLPIAFTRSIPAYKEPYQNVYYFDKLNSDQEIVVPSGEYYAAISNGEIEEGVDIDLYPFFPRWNQGFLGLFGYEYNEKEESFEEYNGKCKTKSIKNIHWLGRAYDPRGLNHTICSKLVVKPDGVTEIKIYSTNSEFRYIRTVAAWVPGIILLTPLFFGSSMRTFDHSLEVLYKANGK